MPQPVADQQGEVGEDPDRSLRSVVGPAAEGRAAWLQAAVARAVRTSLDRRGETVRALAKAAAIPEDRLGRILRGEVWMRLEDVVAIGLALDVDLLAAVALGSHVSRTPGFLHPADAAE